MAPPCDALRAGALISGSITSSRRVAHPPRAQPASASACRAARPIVSTISSASPCWYPNHPPPRSSTATAAASPMRGLTQQQLPSPQSLTSSSNQQYTLRSSQQFMYRFSQQYTSRLLSHAISVKAPKTVTTQQSQQQRGDAEEEDVQVPSHGACIRKLHIKDFALVADQTIIFNPGLNVITGESGAGKSVMVEALSQLCGAPSPPECVRQPASNASIQGTYLLGAAAAAAARQLLEGCGLPHHALPLAALYARGKLTQQMIPQEQQQLIIRREITQQPDGSCRSKCYINGTATSLRVLKNLASLLVDANGQHSSTLLKQPATQLALLDRIAGTGALAAAVGACLREAEHLESQLLELQDMEDGEERDRLQTICDVVGKARIKPGEELRLRQALKRMEGRRAAVEQCGMARMSISGEQGGLVAAVRSVELQLGTVMRQEQQMAAAARAARLEAKRLSTNNNGNGDNDDDSDDDDDDDDDVENSFDDAAEDEDEGSSPSSSGPRVMADALDALALAREQLAVAESAVKAYSRSYQWSQQEHDETSNRLRMVERLLRSHKCRSSGELLDLVEQYSARLEQYYDAEGKQEEWEARLKELHGELHRSCMALSTQRHSAAAKLKCSVESCLTELAMGGCGFDVSISWRPAGPVYSQQDEIALISEEGIWLSVEDMKVGMPHGKVNPPGGSAQTLTAAKETSSPASLSYSAADLDREGDRRDRGMHGSRFLVGPHGLDCVEFLLSAGPSEPLRPLSAVASGGESARIMLALKAAPCSVVLPPPSPSSSATTGTAASPLYLSSTSRGGSGQGPAGQGSRGASDEGLWGGDGGLDWGGPLLPTLVLDELDSGIGARLGASVGQILRRMSSASSATQGAVPNNGNTSQIICITHLPQVACYAANHIKVVKSEDATQRRVITEFKTLSTWDARVEEVAAMLGLEKGVAEDMLRGAHQGGRC